MIVKSVKFLSKYKHFKEGSTFIFHDGVNHDECNTVFSVLVGRNGSGKTTLMSLIPTLFYHIERYNKKIPANFELNYETLIEEENIPVKLCHFNNLITVSVPNIFNDVQIVPRRSYKSNDFTVIDMTKPYILYEDFHKYSPRKVVSSVFSLHGEYPEDRPYNYIGHQIVSSQIITNIYGRNHYNLGSISIGILRLIKLFFNSKKEMTNLLSLFDLKFTFRVLLKYQEEGATWMKANKAWLNKHEKHINSESAYLNDLEFEKSGRKITLSNMSSGEKMLLLRAISILHSIEDNSIIIIEEPELHLDQVWNRQLSSLFTMLYRNYSSHIFIATHNYSIINSINQNSLVFLEDGKSKKIQDNTFLASYDDLFKTLFGNKFGMNQIEKKYLESIAEKSVEELEQEYKRLGSSVFKYLVFLQLKSKKK